MNHDDTHPELQPLIETEIEARLVAWVLGEASAFEIAELERLCREKPELAIFKRRIEAVHGLVGEAARPDTPPLRLSPERRAKVLQAVGLTQATAASSSAEKPARNALAVFPQPKRRDPRLLMGIAAGVAIGGILAVLWVPMADTLEGMIEKKPLRPNPSQTVLGSASSEWDLRASNAPDPAMPPASTAQRKQETYLAERETNRLEGYGDLARNLRQSKADEASGRANVAVEMPLFHSKPPPATSAPSLESRSPGAELKWKSTAPAAVIVAPGVSASYAGGTTTNADGTIAPSPYTVTASQDVGHIASNTLAGSRMNSPVLGLGDSITVVTRQELADSSGADTNDAFLYEANTESGAQWGKLTRPNTVLFGEGAPKAYIGLYAPNLASVELDQKKEDSEPISTQLSWSNTESDRVRGLDQADNSRDFLVGGQLQNGFVRADTAKDSRNNAVVNNAQSIANAERGINSLVNELEKQTAPAAPAVPARQSGGKAKPTPAPDETSTAVEPVSTFSLHVSDASFQFAQAALARGEVPDPARIRPEEFYNAFDYGDPAPAPGEKIGCRIEQAAHPFLQQRNLVRIAMRVPATGRAGGRPLYLTVLLDTSGSMEREDRRATVQHALAALASLLKPEDRVTLIGFARLPRLLAENLPGDQAGQLHELAAQTPAEGGTNLEAALELAIEKAQESFDPDAQNRIVLITDGAANLGNADPAALAMTIETTRQQGIAFDACGVGTNGLDDEILEALTRKGDGRYYVLENPEDADAGFARKLAGAFRPAAQNVKMQVRFNPARVAHYRLIGFEQHRLREEDFRNDKVDAAELAAEEAAVAVYQVEVLPEGEGELGDVFVRFRDTASGAMVENFWTIGYEPRIRAFDQATPSLQLAGVAALLAEKLRGGAMTDLVRLEELWPIVNRLRGHYVEEDNVQVLIGMFEHMRRISRE